jgi:hypothetical protein
MGNFFDAQVLRIPAQTLRDRSKFTLGDVAWQIRYHGAGPVVEYLSPPLQIDRHQAGCRLNVDPDLSASSRIEAGLYEFCRDSGAHAFQQRQKSVGNEIEGRGKGVVGASLEFNVGRARCQAKRRQDGLQNQRATAGAAYTEAVVAGTDGCRPEDQFPGTELIAVHFGGADIHGGMNGGEMLSHQPGFAAAATDVDDPKGRFRDQRQGQGTSQYLTASFSPGAVYGKHGNSLVAFTVRP